MKNINTFIEKLKQLKDSKEKSIDKSISLFNSILQNIKKDTRLKESFKDFADISIKNKDKGQKIIFDSIEECLDVLQNLAKDLSKDAQILELTETIQRLAADFENHKKRSEENNAKLAKFASAEIITKLLPILDSFELALKSTQNKEECIKGIELIFSQFHQILEESGLMPIQTNTGKFDPYIHEVLMTEESEKEEGTIIEEFQKGYLLNGNVIRHSKVKVVKQKEKKKDDKNE